MTHTGYYKNISIPCFTSYFTTVGFQTKILIPEMNSLNWLKGNYFGNLASVMLALGGIFCSPVTFSSAVIAYYYSIIVSSLASPSVRCSALSFCYFISKLFSHLRSGTPSHSFLSYFLPACVRVYYVILIYNLLLLILFCRPKTTLRIPFRRRRRSILTALMCVASLLPSRSPCTVSYLWCF